LPEEHVNATLPVLDQSSERLSFPSDNFFRFLPDDQKQIKER